MVSTPRHHVHPSKEQVAYLLVRENDSVTIYRRVEIHTQVCNCIISLRGDGCGGCIIRIVDRWCVELHRHKMVTTILDISLRSIISVVYRQAGLLNARVDTT